VVRIHRTAITAFAFVLAGCASDEPTSPPDNGNNGVLSVSLSADRDNTLYEDAAGALSNGAGEFLFAGTTSTTNQGLLRRALIRFDIAGSAIPAGSQIDSVKLTLFMSRTNAGPTDVFLHAVTTDWGEAGSDAGGAEGIGAASELGDATWIHRSFDTDLWTNPGGDFVSTASASAEVLTTGAYTWGTTDAMVADVQAWLDTPAGNFGWILIGDETQLTTAKRFDSRTNAVTANRPDLTIYYSTP
jgi:hypothetical protein